MLNNEIGNRLCMAVYTEQALTTVPPDLRDRVISHTENCIEFDLPREGDEIIRTLDILRGSGAVIVDLQTRHPDLEDVFVSLTSSEGAQP